MYKSTKPILDFALALALLIIFSPLFLVLLFILLVHFSGNPLFTQKRIGKNEKPFYILKFRTMCEQTDKNGNLLPDEIRTTKLGNLLRKTGLDELPQLFNILKGEMSFVGPRPLLPEYLPLYDVISRKRHNIRPGITGLAQVHGGNSLAWEKRFEWDRFYVTNVSFLLDLQILWATFRKINSSKGENIGRLG